MSRTTHCDRVGLEQLEQELGAVKDLNRKLSLASAPLKIYDLTPYDYMFKKLHRDPSAWLQSDNPKEMVSALTALGETMHEPGTDDALKSGIPAAYTYFGQFVDHDITLELQSEKIVNLNDENLKPLNIPDIQKKIKNRRSPTIDLDSVYGVTSDGEPVPRQCSRLAVGITTFASENKLPGQRPPNLDINNDVPRKVPAPENPVADREALIGDARNDDNLIVSQMHVAFLRAHNALVGRGLFFTKARKTLVQHFQWLIIHDFLKRVCNREIIDEILTYGNRFFRPSMCNLYMPLEFSAAAFRFGHSMVRPSYQYNINFTKENPAKLSDLFSIPSFRGLPETLGHIPEQCIIEWKNFLDGGKNFARKIDTLLVDPLADLPNPPGQILSGVKRSLAVRNLLRGYLLRIPTGQKVAEACGFQPLTEQQILQYSTPDQRKVLEKSGLHRTTPLWYYILAEAARGHVLGDVGSTIVGEVLIGLVRWTEDSILSEPDWKPTLGSKAGVFTLKDFFQLAGVWT